MASRRPKSVEITPRRIAIDYGPLVQPPEDWSLLPKARSGSMPTCIDMRTWMAEGARGWLSGC